MYKSPLKKIIYKKIIIGHICYSKQNFVFSTYTRPRHTKFCLNKNKPHYIRFHVNCYYTLSKEKVELYILAKIMLHTCI